MKKIGIVTINDFNNYGNRLQCYAVEKILQNYNFKVENLFVFKVNIFASIKRIVKYIFNINYERKKWNRLSEFKKFNNNIFFRKNWKSNIENYDYFITGSDQVWNPNFKTTVDENFLTFAVNMKKISFSASFGINYLPEKYIVDYRNRLSNFKAISVREDSGKKIVEDLTGRKDVEVLVDPTMLLTSEEWDKVSKKPKNLKSKKYILNYFLGNLSEERKNEINRIAKENDCDVINILDKNDPMYVSGPSEFLWLEKNAFLICTDSFHSSVFAILYNRPFVVFDREDSNANMGSRIDTLLSKFELKDRRYNGKEITKDNLNHDYSKAYEILEKEREKSDKFLRNALDIK